MNAYLLYKDRDWSSPEYYYDYRSITQDLGLNTLFLFGSKEVEYDHGTIKNITDSDVFIRDVMQGVVLTPLKTEAEIVFRQEILKDCIAHEDMTEALYRCVSKMLEKWDMLGRRINGKNSGKDNIGKLITRIQELRLFTDTLTTLKTILKETYVDLNSEGLKGLCDRLCAEYPDELEAELKDLITRMDFYVSDGSSEGETPMIGKPRIVLECNVGGGCKCEDFYLKEVNTLQKKYRGPKSVVSKVSKYIGSYAPGSVDCDASPECERQANNIEYYVVKYMMSFCEPFMKNFENFFDRFHYQIAFYRGAVNLSHHMKRFGVDYCYPTVTGQDRLVFSELKEFVMCIEQRVNAVGNTCAIDPKMLIIITGANQGGKSTFLRSLGIAQVMMQCGLMVVATSYASGIFTHLFMHFTRREDSEMNSGRLDEELNRMSQIIDHLGPDSLILLNESFATTTEKDGSVIAYDIIKALKEAGVKIITVTHLLSFAQKMYSEAQEVAARGEESGVTFFCAERKEDGSRTFKMKQSVPELTSFGLDLYERIIEKKFG